MSQPINPETKVGALLEAYPGIDDVLIELAPAFAKLKNPILRKTVAKVATLEQAARIGGLTTRDLVVKLREAAGQPSLDVIDEPTAGTGDGTAPAWLRRECIRETIDADRMLERGIHPLGTVQQSVVSLEEGGIVALTSSFRPEPLIQAMEKGGLAVYSEETSPGRHTTYFCKTSDDEGLANRISRQSCGGSGCG